MAQASAESARAMSMHRGVNVQRVFIAGFSETPGGVLTKYSVDKKGPLNTPAGGNVVGIVRAGRCLASAPWFTSSVTTSLTSKERIQK